jgi:hypothetical protein
MAASSSSCTFFSPASRRLPLAEVPYLRMAAMAASSVSGRPDMHT